MSFPVKCAVTVLVGLSLELVPLPAKSMGFEPLLASHYAAKAKMIGSRTDFALAARSNDIARAVLVGAQIRAAAMHVFGLIGL